MRDEDRVSELGLSDPRSISVKVRVIEAPLPTLVVLASEIVRETGVTALVDLLIGKANASPSYTRSII